MEIGLIFMQDIPKTWTRSEKLYITHYQCVHFLKDQSAKCPLEWSMNLIKSKTLGGCASFSLVYV